jgi:hypothetical protein
MGAVELEGVQNVSKPTTTEEVVSLGALAELTGFPVDYIKRELLSGDEEVTEMTMTELRKKVLAYLDSNF